MVRKRDDAALASGGPTDQQVADYLRRHPDFLLRHQDLLLALSPPSRYEGEDGIVDMQVFMIDRMKDELDRVKGAAEHLIHTSRSNMSTQVRTHRAALVLLSAETLGGIASAVADDLPALLDVDVATLCFEESDRALPELALPNILRLKRGTVEAVLGGRDRDCALSEEMPGDPALFGEGASLVQSSAAVRLTPGGRCPSGLLALGSRHGRTFHTGQGTELLAFLARVTEGCVRRFVG
ncbi:MAG: DUF484 family protein [Solirubrobacterales bacterium]